MAVLPIYTYDAKILRTKALAVKTMNEEVVKLVFNMFETMKEASGIGLAANQVGSHHSLFVVDLSDVEGYQDSNPMIFINPTITEMWGADIEYEEGCLSVPQIRENIIRPDSIHISYRDINFAEQELETDGLLSRVIQHEYDHLEGVFFTDYLKGLKKRLILPALNRIKRGEIETDYKLASVDHTHVL